jgi:hypothetical protein
MTHTPGPWYAVDNGHYIDINIADGIYSPSVASVLSSKFLESGDNSKANADLIAAAPDLLDALRDMVSDRNELSEGTIAFARWAIAKAEGRS